VGFFADSDAPPGFTKAELSVNFSDKNYNQTLSFKPSMLLILLWNCYFLECWCNRTACFRWV